MASSRKLLRADPRSSGLPQHLAVFLRRHVPPSSRLLLALSGGLDSCVLLDLLTRAAANHACTLSALHVHHGISPNADAWAEFARSLCAARGIPCRVVRVEVPRDSGLGLEAAAREARYAVLCAEAADFVVLAHHRDDQAETLLLQLLRGAGVGGLAGMGAAKDRLLRPLLDVPRAALAAYAATHGLVWINDASNLDPRHDRNFLRHRILPELQQRFPAAGVTLARSAGHLAEAAALLNEVAQQDAAQWVVAGRLRLQGLRALSAPRARNLLRYWLGCHGVAPAPATRRVQELERQLLQAGENAQVCVTLPGGSVHRYRGEAWFEPATTSAFAARRWRGETVLDLPGGRLLFSRCQNRGLDCAAVETGVVWIRPRSGGECLRPDARRPVRDLRHLFQEAGLPAWRRPHWPLIYLDDRLAAVPGIGVACDLQAQAGQEGWWPEWLPAASVGV